MQDGDTLDWEGDNNNFNAGQSINTTTLIISLSIGMIAFSGLLVPVLGLQAGYITSSCLLLLISFISYYTAYLIILHLGKAKSMKKSVLAHFGNDYKYMTLYSTINWISLVPLNMLIFNFACV